MYYASGLVWAAGAQALQTTIVDSPWFGSSTFDTKQLGMKRKTMEMEEMESNRDQEVNKRKIFHMKHRIQSFLGNRKIFRGVNQKQESLALKDLDVTNINIKYYG